MPWREASTRIQWISLALLAATFVITMWFAIHVPTNAAIEAKRAAIGARQVLCIGILHNTDNTAHNDPQVVDLCAAVGIKPLTP